jgi:hypothetical protein
MTSEIQRGLQIAWYNRRLKSISMDEQLMRQYSSKLLDGIISFGNEAVVGGIAERIHHIDSNKCGVKAEQKICSHPARLKCELALTQLIVDVDCIRLLKKTVIWCQAGWHGECAHFCGNPSISSRTAFHVSLFL